VTFRVKDPARQRAALNAEWVKIFPDPDSPPARHTLTLPADIRALVQADFTAVLSFQAAAVLLNAGTIDVIARACHQARQDRRLIRPPI
jgi:hypothetical protein